MYEIARLASQSTACGLAVARTARTASSPACGVPLSPALARRSRQSVAVAWSMSVPCCRYHSTPTARSRSGNARSSSAAASSAATKSPVLRLSDELAPGICTARNSLLTKFEVRRHRSMILHLTMATELSGSTECVWCAGPSASAPVDSGLRPGEVRQETTRMEGVHA